MGLGVVLPEKINGISFNFVVNEYLSMRTKHLLLWRCSSCMGVVLGGGKGFNPVMLKFFMQ